MNKNKFDQLLERGYDFDIQQSFQNGLQIFKKAPLFSISYTMLILSLQFLFVIYIPDFLFVFSIFLAGPLFAGFYLVANKISRNEEVVYPDFFKGFHYYIPVILVWIVGQLFTVVGILFLVIPGIYLMIGYMFSLLMAIFGGLDFWNALEYSRKLVHLKWWKFFLFGIVVAIINILGALVFVVGLVFTIPLTYYTIYHIFEEITQEAIGED